MRQIGDKNITITSHLYQSVDLIIGEVQPGEVTHPSEDLHLDDLQLVVADVQLHHPTPPVRADGRVGQSLDFVVTERRIRNKNDSSSYQIRIVIKVEVFAF